MSCPVWEEIYKSPLRSLYLSLQCSLSQWPHRHVDWWSTKAECRPLRVLSIALCTLPDSLLISMHASLRAVTTSCMDLVVSDRPAPIVACACEQQSRPHTRSFVPRSTVVFTAASGMD